MIKTGTGSTNESKAAAIMKILSSRHMRISRPQIDISVPHSVVPETAQWLKLLPVKSNLTVLIWLNRNTSVRLLDVADSRCVRALRVSGDDIISRRWPSFEMLYPGHVLKHRWRRLFGYPRAPWHYNRARQVK